MTLFVELTDKGGILFHLLEFIRVRAVFNV